MRQQLMDDKIKHPESSFYEKCNQYSCTLYYTAAVALTWMITDSAAYLNGWLIRAAQQKFTVPQFK